jgi:predicted amino acid-binding ACT domain protein
VGIKWAGRTIFWGNINMSMRNFNVVKMDKKGRILIPFHIRYNIGNYDEFLIMNNGEKELKIFPLINGQSADIKLQLTDVLGSMARATDILAKHNIDILMSQSKTLEKGKLAEWQAIVDISNCKDMEKLKKDLKACEEILDFEVNIR